MTRSTILEELRKLAPAERLTIIENALRLVREDLQRGIPSAVQADRKRQLSIVAEALLPDYSEDAELTSFTALDDEDSHA